jgi:receptor-type tyrosine-protein phosphatase beta
VVRLQAQPSHSSCPSLGRATGRFIVWYRNETTLLLLLQPPYPSGEFDAYVVQIRPADALQAQLIVRKDQQPPVPAQAAFHGLVPGRSYHITVRTRSGDQLSAATHAQYRTLPLPPTALATRLGSLTTNSFEITWSPPEEQCEFDRYQVTLVQGARGHSPASSVSAQAQPIVRFDDQIEPGRTYEVSAKSVSGNVLSRSITLNVTTRPLPVLKLTARLDAANRIVLGWLGSNDSIQDSYQIRYHELDAFNAPGATKTVSDAHALLTDLLHGRNYSIALHAQSGSTASEPVVVFQATRPAPPVIESVRHLSGVDGRDQLNVTWKSDVTSKQEEFELHVSAVTSGLTAIPIRSVNQTSVNGGGGSSSSSTSSGGVGSGGNGGTSGDSSSSAASQPVRRVDSEVVRLDEGQRQIRLVTRQHWLVLDGLTAGALYQVNVSAISYGLHSEPHTASQLLPPRVPSDFRLVSADNGTVELAWRRPPATLLDGYALRYRSAGSAGPWTERWLPAEQTSIRLVDLWPGERYVFRLLSLSARSESSENVELQHSLHPSPVDSVSHVNAAGNVTFKLLPPIGKVDYYLVQYHVANGKPIAFHPTFRSNRLMKRIFSL